MYPRIDPCPNPRKPLSRPALRDGVDCAGALRAPRSLSCTFFFTQSQPSPGILPKRYLATIRPHEGQTEASRVAGVVRCPAPESGTQGFTGGDGVGIVPATSLFFYPPISELPSLCMYQRK